MKTQVIAVLVGSGLALAASSSLLATGIREDQPAQAPATRAFSPAPAAITSQESGRGAFLYANKRPAPSSAPEPAEAPPLPFVSIVPGQALDGHEGTLQERLIAHLNRTRFVPEGREAHFQWVRDCGGTITGWSVQGTETGPADDGDLITIRLHPIHTSGATAVDDGFFETYRLTDEGAAFLSSRPGPGPKVITF